jgi:cytochrome c oxidase subunit 3
VAVAPAPTGALEPSEPAPPHRATPLSVGVVVWLASELMFFAGLFAAYYTLRAESRVWPPADVDLDIPRAAASTVVLLASSATMHLSVARADRGDRRGALRWLYATFLLGAAFLVNLGFEWAANDFSISSHAYGSIYYLITGAHGAHLAAGLVLMIAAAVAVSGSPNRLQIGPVFTVSTYYWHFVDLVWLAVFATIFLVQ